MKALVLMAFGSTCALAPAGDPIELANYRDWTSTDGKKFKALLLEVGPNEYTLKGRRDGRTYDIPVDRISDEDKKLVSDANTLVDSAKSRCVEAGVFKGFPDPSESFWRVAAVLGRAHELGALACGEYPLTTGVIRLASVRNFRRESDRSYLVEGEHVMVRIQSNPGDTSQSVQASGEKLQVVRTARVMELDYRGYYGWEYDSRLKVYRRNVCNRRELFQPAVGTRAPFKVIGCSVEKVGVGSYLVITLRAQDRR